jgi:hypothetical protein
MPLPIMTKKAIANYWGVSLSVTVLLATDNVTPGFFSTQKRGIPGDWGKLAGRELLTDLSFLDI